jgi:SAM-dependent methyltransferase
MLMSISSISSPESNWKSWPQWQGDDIFSTRRYKFKGSVSQFDDKTTEGSVAILKHKQFIEIYRELLSKGAERIFEIGFFQGGMPLFILDMLRSGNDSEAIPAKIVGIDYYPPTPELCALIKNSGISENCKLYGNVLQDDIPKIKSILNDEFSNQNLDLIIDDCSHEYDNTKVCFENLFSYLKPGGKYVIEDWGWQHWRGEPWQSPASHFHGKPSMTNLIIELIMTLGTSPDIIARVDIVSEFCVVVTRGPNLAHGERIDLGNSYLSAGRKFKPM